MEAWLLAHPEITIVARDRGGGDGEATTRALPDAVQTADRWHLMENASAAFLDAVRRSMSAIRKATVDPERLTRAERLRYEGYLRREATGEAILGSCLSKLTLHHKFITCSSIFFKFFYYISAIICKTIY